MSKHTPAPWFPVEANLGRVEIRDVNQHCLARIISGGRMPELSTKEQWDNACLMAAASDMWAVLQDALNPDLLPEDWMPKACAVVDEVKRWERFK